MSAGCLKSLLLAALLAWAAVSAPGARADSDCGVSLSASGVLVNWNQNFNFQAVTISVSKTKSSACDVTLGFSRGTSSDYNRRMTGSGGTLSYQLFKDSALTQILKDVPDITTSNDAITVTLPKGNQSASVTYYVQIPLSGATQPVYKASGSYVDTFVIHAYSHKLDDGPQVLGNDGVDASANVTILTSIPKILEISLVSPGENFDPSQTNKTVSFGDFDGSAISRALDLRVRTNAGYAISVSSANNGALKRASGATGPGIPYSLTVNSVPKSLSGSATNPVRIATGGGQTSTQGTSSALTFEATASSSSFLAGQYQDVITVTAATTE